MCIRDRQLPTNIIIKYLMGCNVYDKCFEIASVLSLQFNAAKSRCIAFGKTSKFLLSVMVFGVTTLRCSFSVKCLSVYLLGESS